MLLAAWQICTSLHFKKKFFAFYTSCDFQYCFVFEKNVTLGRRSHKTINFIIRMSCCSVQILTMFRSCPLFSIIESNDVVLESKDVSFSEDKTKFSLESYKVNIEESLNSKIMSWFANKIYDYARSWFFDNNKHLSFQQFLSSFLLFSLHPTSCQ